MRASLQFDRQKSRGFVSALCSGLLSRPRLALASPAFAAGGGGGGGEAEGRRRRRREAAEPAEARAAVAGDDGSGGAPTHRMNKSDLTTCAPGQVWDTKHRKCLTRHSGVLPDPDLTEYAYALAKADRYQEAIDVLDLLNNPNTPRALNYRGYATRKLGRTDEGIGYYLKSVALDPNYPQVREYLGEAYVIQGKYDLAKAAIVDDREALRLRTASITRIWRTRSTQAHAL